MNILVRTYSGNTVVRPDTTWEKDNEDFYPPEFVNRLTFTPVLFARISKPGRSIVRRFAARYYDAVNYGMLLYPENMIGSSVESYAQAICLDHTSFLPSPLSMPEELFKDGALSIRLDGSSIYEYAPTQSGKDLIEEALEEVSKMCYIRTGDIVAVELDARKLLTVKENGTVHIEACSAGTKTMDYRIIF